MITMQKSIIEIPSRKNWKKRRQKRRIWRKYQRIFTSCEENKSRSSN